MSIISRKNQKGVVHYVYIIVALFLAVFVWAIANQNFDIRKSATSDNRPTPKSTQGPRKSPTPTVVPTPSPTPDPNNQYPTVVTSSLPAGFLGRFYYAEVKGSDTNLGDTLSMNISGLPKGLTWGTCNSFINGSAKDIVCQISGVPAKGTAGNHNIYVTVSDLRGGVAQKTFTLTINKKYLLF